jgi:hypothetical protein
MAAFFQFFIGKCIEKVCFAYQLDQQNDVVGTLPYIMKRRILMILLARSYIWSFCYLCCCFFHALTWFICRPLEPYSC